MTSVTAGGATTYTITVTNAGPSDVGGATVVDTAPTGVTFGAWTCAVSNPGSGGSVTTACGASSGSGNISTTVTMQPGAVIVYTVPATIAAGASGTISNTASVAVPAGVTDPNPANNSATDSDTISAVADLSITKTDGVASVTAGSTTTYTVVVTNNGPSDVRGATVVDTAPAGAAFGTWSCSVSNPGSGGTVTTACGASNGSGNLSTTATMKPGAIVTYTIPATIAASATGSIVNVATANVPAGVTDPAPANNAGTSSVPVIAAVVPITPVPTLETYALAILTLMLMLLGALAYRRAGPF